MPVAKPLTQVAQQRLLHQIERTADRRINKNREFTTGATVSEVKTKAFPVDAGPGDPVTITFVVDVRLLDHPGDPIIRDVLVANIARQTVADGASQSSTPVLLERDKAGVLTVIGRALHSVPEGHCRDYYDVSDVGGFDLSYVFGMESIVFSTLPADIQTGLSAFLVLIGEPALAPTDVLFKDPVLAVLGATYWKGYITPTSARRSFATGCLKCVQTVETVPWGDPRWRWGLPPVGLGASVVSWGWTEHITTCT